MVPCLQINFNCWNTTEEITAMMKESGKGLSESAYIRQWAEFQNKAAQMLDVARYILLVYFIKLLDLLYTFYCIL